MVGGLAELAAQEEAPINLATGGFSSSQVDPCWVFQFYIAQKGTLHASWDSYPPTSAAFFATGQYNPGSINCTPSKWGTPFWVGQTAVLNDSFALHVAVGEHDLVFLGSPNGSDVKGTSLVLAPDPPSWWP